MCACGDEPGYVCSTHRGDPFLDFHLWDQGDDPDPVQEARERSARLEREVLRSE